MNWLSFAFRNVLRNKRRSIVTTLIVAVGTAGILIGGGFALFTYEALREMAARDSGHLVMAKPDYFNQQEDAVMQHGLEGYKSIQAKVEKEPHVRMALPRIQFSGLVSNGDKSAVFVGAGVDPQGEFYVKGPTLKVLSGNVLSASPKAGELPEIVLGEGLAKDMKVSPGSGLTLLTTTTAGSLNALDVRVRGVVTVGVPDVDKRLVYVDIPTAQSLLLTDRVSTLSVYLNETGDTEWAADWFRKAFPAAAIQTWRDQAFYYVAVRDLYNRIFSILGLVIVLMVMFAVSNTLGMSILERTREVGALRALGTFQSQLVKVFALEGLILSLAGTVLGMLSAAGISLALYFIDVQMPPPPGRSVGYPLHINLSPSLYAATTLAIVLISLASAWFVSRRTTSKPIIEALSHV